MLKKKNHNCRSSILNIEYCGPNEQYKSSNQGLQLYLICFQLRRWYREQTTGQTHDDRTDIRIPNGNVLDMILIEHIVTEISGQILFTAPLEFLWDTLCIGYWCIPALFFSNTALPYCREFYIPNKDAAAWGTGLFKTRLKLVSLYTVSNRVYFCVC